jgi:hypothetical protein
MKTCNRIITLTALTLALAGTAWAQLLAVIEPFCPKGERGRPPLSLVAY